MWFVFTSSRTSGLLTFCGKETCPWSVPNRHTQVWDTWGAKVQHETLIHRERVKKRPRFCSFRWNCGSPILPRKAKTDRTVIPLSPISIFLSLLRYIKGCVYTRVGEGVVTRAQREASSITITLKQCSGSMAFWCGSRSCYFRHWPSRCQQKTILKNRFFC